MNPHPHAPNSHILTGERARQDDALCAAVAASPTIGETWYYRRLDEASQEVCVYSGVVVAIEFGGVAHLSHQDGRDVVPLTHLRKTFRQALDAPAIPAPERDQ